MTYMHKAALDIYNTLRNGDRVPANNWLTLSIKARRDIRKLLQDDDLAVEQTSNHDRSMVIVRW